MKRSLLLPPLCCALALAMGLPLQAQIARPGNARGTTGTTGRTTTGGGGGSTRSAGPRQYRSNTELGDATIQIDPETRSLVIVTDETTHAELTKVIRTLDKPKPQVLIKVVFLEVTYNDDIDLGVEANYTFKNETGTGAVTGSSVTTRTTGTTANGTTTTRSTDLSAPALAANMISAGSLFGLASATDGTFVRLLTDDWSATIRALSTQGKVEVLSRPSIMARNNQEAVIVVGSEVPFITNSRTDALGNLTNTITYDNVGIILRVTPFITSEGTVEMIVAPEISSLTAQTVPISSTVSAPVIAKRSAETVVVTPNGQTVVIGGLMETQRIEQIRKIPLLGDIPYLGAAFRRTVKNDVKKELMIFLTPQIVNDAAGLQTITEREVDRTELVEQAFTPQDFDKYLGAPELFPAAEIPPTRVVETRRATAVKAGPAPKAPVVQTKRTVTTTTKSNSPGK